MLAEEIRTLYGIDNKPNPSYVGDLSAVVATHLSANSFNRNALIKDFEKALRGPFLNGMSLDDYVYREADGGSHYSIALRAMFDRLYALYIAKRRYPINLEFVLAGIRTLNIIYHLATPPADEDPPRPGLLPTRSHSAPAPIDRAAIEEMADTIVCVHPLFSYLIAYYRPFNIVRPVGVGDLKVVKQWLCKYELGEIAHIENVLLGEKKRRVHRLLDRSEQTTFTSEETVEETKKDLESTDRYELAKEVEATLQRDLGLEASGTVSGSYGMVEFSVSAGVSFSQSETESKRTTSNYARDLVSRSANRLQRTAQTERTVTIISEAEEINEHGVDNEDGDGHVIGIYRWLEKRYHAQVFNYGKRLMFEVVIPEPAAFVRYAAKKNQVSDTTLREPTEPEKPNIAVSELDQTTIDKYSKLYSLHDLEPEPPESMRQSSTLQQSELPPSAVHQATVAVPEGYEATKLDIAGAGHNVKQPGVAYQLTVMAGGELALLWSGQNEAEYTEEEATLEFSSGVSTQLVASVFAHNVHTYALDLTVTFSRTPAHMLSWQMRTYNRIVTAYEDLLAKYELELSAYNRQLDAINARKALEIRGLNPKINEQIIRIELKKHSITMLAREFDTDNSDDTVFDGLGNIGEEPAINIDKTTEESPVVQFLEQAFEWTQLTYLLYPYFWGNRTEWVERQKGYSETDPVFGRFLQAGYARVLIPVRPAYEVAVLHFLYTREPWNGGPAPGIFDPLYVSIHEEIRREQDDLEGATPEGEPWPVVLPTSLVYLQPTAEVPTFQCPELKP